MSISNIFIRIFEQNYLKYFGKAKYTTINYRLHKLFSKCLGINNFENSEVSGEKWVVNYLLPHYGFRNNAVFFDVGANVGDYSKEVIASYPGTQAFLFEPHPQTFQKLQNESALKAVRKFNIAFGEKLEKINFYDRSDISGGSSHASFYKEVFSGIHNQNPVGFKVEVKTLDSFCSDNNVLKIDFLKIDTEGHELSVLKGASHLISEKKIKLIQFEFNEMNAVSRTYMRDFSEFLADYQLHRVLPDGYFPLTNCLLDNELFGFQNILAIPKK